MSRPRNKTEVRYSSPKGNHGVPPDEPAACVMKELPPALAAATMPRSFAHIATEKDAAVEPITYRATRISFNSHS